MKYYSREIQFQKNLEQRSLTLFSPAMPKGTVIFIQKLRLTIVLVMVTQYLLMSAVFFERFQLMPVFESVTCESLQSGYADITRYAYRYFAIDKLKPMNLWS